MDAELIALAEACERAADTHDGISDVMNGVQPPVTRHVGADAATLRAHAAALRAGRVTITEPTTNEATNG